MTQRLGDIAAHITDVRQLGAIVTAMRGIAAARAQQSRGVLAGIEAHARIVSRAIGEALLLSPHGSAVAEARPNGRKAVILFCAEGGFCGGLSDRVLDAAMGDGKTRQPIFIVGTRGVTIARERGVEAAWTAASATQMGAVPAVAERIAAELYRGIAGGKYLRAEMIYPRTVIGAPVSIERQPLLPLDLSRFRFATPLQPPLVNLHRDVLVEQLAGDYVYALLCNAAMHSFIAENEARMTAMAAAREHIDENLAALVRHEHQVRQEEITNEIIELSTAAFDFSLTHRA